MADDALSNLIGKLSEAKYMPVNKIKQLIREKAIANAIKHLSDIGQTPFSLGEERFEVLVDDKEKEIIDDLKTKGLKGLGIIALLLGIDS